MSRQIMVQFPDGATERQYAEALAAFSAVAQRFAAASPPLRVLVQHDGQALAPVEQPPAGQQTICFTVAMRGYDRRQVEEWINRTLQTAPPYPVPTFDIVLRGYHRGEVDQWVRRAMGE